MIENLDTNIFEIGMVVCIGLLNYFLLYMKYSLMKKGMKVNWVLKWGHDYQRFKNLIKEETDDDLKLLNGRPPTPRHIPQSN
jgi:hypothetical protein